MLNDLISAYGSKFLVAALGVSLALLCLFIVLWLLRNRAPSPFVRGGRNRQPRLQVLDAAAIDTRRRIVLIRRDNVEHLVMIGGPTDLLIETGIGDERHYLNARMLQAQPGEDETRLAHQAAASLPAAQPDQTAAPMAAETIVAPKAAVMDRGPLQTVRQQPASQQVSEKSAVEASRPAPIADRASESKPTAEPATILAPKAQIEPRPAPQSDTRSPAPAAVSATPTIPVAAATTAVAPVIAAVTPAAPVLTRPPEPVAVSSPSIVIPPEQRPAVTPTVSASIAADLHAQPTDMAPMATPQDRMPVSRPIEETAPTIELDEPVEAAIVPAIQAPAVSAVTSPTIHVGVNIEPELSFAAPTLDAPQQQNFAEAPPVDAAPDLDTPPRLEAPLTTDVAPALSPAIDAPSAEEVLDAARSRVLSSPTNDGLARPFDAARFTQGRQESLNAGLPATEPAMRDESPASRDLSDFERVLEEEMALHIAADPAPPRPQTAAAPPIPALMPETRPDRPRPPIGAIVAEPRQPAPPSGANPAQPVEEPNLQNEIARIFGEMSASRNS